MLSNEHGRYERFRPDEAVAQETRSPAPDGLSNLVSKESRKRETVQSQAQENA
jgi:hypothetical protein